MLKRLKSLFIVEVDDKNTKKKGAPKKEKPVPNPPSVKESADGIPGKVTNKFLDVLFDAMERNNLDGFDYLEFKHSLLSLKKANITMDDGTRFKSAFAMAQTMGATVEQLIETAQHYLQILAEEEAKFEQTLIKQKEKRIGTKEQEMSQLEALVKDKQTQIEQLKSEIQEHQTQLDTLKKHLKSATAKIETTKNNFIASYNSLVGQIYRDIESIKQYLQ